MLNINQFRELIIRPALVSILSWSKDAEELLVFTCAVESLGGTYLEQIKGTALGIYQMEPNTHMDIWENFIKKRSALIMQLSSNFNTNGIPNADRLIYDLRYASVMTRIHYMRNKELIPPYEDEHAMWDYYKRYYNTQAGKADKTTALIKYHNFTHLHLDNS